MPRRLADTQFHIIFEQNTRRVSPTAVSRTSSTKQNMLPLCGHPGRPSAQKEGDKDLHPICTAPARPQLHKSLGCGLYLLDLQGLHRGPPCPL